MFTHPDPAVGRYRYRYAVLALVLVGYFMIILDNSIVFTGIPQIQRELGLSTEMLAWVQNAYALMFGGFLLLVARAGDLFGRRRMLVVGLAIFGSASLAIGLAPSGTWLIAARAVQGIGSAILAPATLALLTATFPDGPERTRAVAWYGAVAGIGASLGLVLGRVLADWLSWRAGFLVNVPIAAAMITATLRVVAWTPRRVGRFDLPGALTSTLGTGLLLLGVVRSSETGWTDTGTVSAVVAGVLLLVGFVLVERRCAAPILPLGLFRSRQRAGAYVTRMLFIGAMIGFFYFVTQFLQTVYGFSALETGLSFLPMTAVNFAVAMAVPRLTARFGNPALIVAGVAVTMVGMGWLSLLPTDPAAYVVGIALPMALIGAGQGLAFGPLTAAGVAGVAPRDAGAASGAVNAFHQTGGALGLGLLVAASSAAAPSGPGVEVTAIRAAAALTTGTGLLAAALVTTLLCVVPATILRERRPRNTEPAAPATAAH